jgi:tetratricopeptide (TPR) repeat protein
MLARLQATLRSSPVTVPAFVALALSIVWLTSQAGYPLTHWAPGGLLVLALLGIAAAVNGLHLGELPKPVKIALGAFAAYTALSFLSILWADVPADAWEGANRTLLYLLVFALFACWPQHSRSAALLLIVWTVAVIVLGLVVALHLDGASRASLQEMLPEARLVYPSSYANANAAQWMMALWPALLLARSRHVPWAVRGVLAGGAVLLAELALLSLSRGALYATPIMIALVFILLPGRVRTFTLFVPVAIGIAAAAPAVLKVSSTVSDVSGHKQHGEVDPSTLHIAIASALLAALVVGVVVAFAAALEHRGVFAESAIAKARRAIAVFAIALLAVGIVGGLIVAGNPVHRLEHAWQTFKSPAAYAADATGNRLIGGLGSQRYDVYRVALDEFIHHPLIGIGSDNFAEPYLAHGRTEVTPHYPHSVELRVLTETGLLGALFALVGLAAALVAAVRAFRFARPEGADTLAATVIAASLAGFGYWLVHGSFDWFWEFAGLGMPAFALLGLACSLTPRRAPAAAATERPAEPQRSHPRALRLASWIGVGGAALAAAASFALPWFSQLEVESAAAIWTKAPRAAYARLDEAANLNPLSDQPYVLAGSIALRYNDLPRAREQFSLALKRTPKDAYATLELGAIVSEQNQPHQALLLIERAYRLNPRDAVTDEALRWARKGFRVDPEVLNQAILAKARQLA